MHLHPDNHNRHLYYGDTFEGLPLMVEKGPFIHPCLALLKRTIDLALDQYSRVLALRVDLRLPLRVELPDHAFTNEVVSRFIASFKAKIEYDRSRARERYQYANCCKVRYFWTREVGGEGWPHYHVLILLNRDAYYTIGRLRSERVNIFRRLEEAWASALSLPADAISGLVEIPRNAAYRVNRDKQEARRELEDLFYRASYLCKAATKRYGQRHHSFGASRG